MASKFDDFAKNELKKCEWILMENYAYESLPKYIGLSASEFYDQFGNETGKEYYKKMCDSKNCYEQLAVIYKYLGEEEKSKRMFTFISSISIPTSRYDKLSEEMRKSSNALGNVSLREIEKAAQIDLSGGNRAVSRQLLEWATENLYLSDELQSGMIKHSLYNDIATWNLWRGYSLIILGRFTEVLDHLMEVAPNFSKYKKRGGDIWQKLEYYLVKALVPLCEYKLNPNEINKKNARQTIEDFINNFSNNYERLEAYLYYYHLKAVFPEVYSDVASASKTGLIQAKSDISARPGISKSAPEFYKPGFYETHGSVIVFDMESGSLEEFGTNKELEEFVEMVKTIGNYPVLSRLFEIYALEEEQDPAPLIEDCERLLATPVLNGSIKVKTGKILEVARDAANASSKVILYFDPEA